MQLLDRIPILLQPVSSDFNKLPASRFTWKDALYLREWGWSCYPNDQQIVNIMLCAGKLEQISKYFFNAEIEIVSWLRPPQYNAAINGARKSAHIEGAAVDFKIKGAEQYVIRERLKSELQRLDIRMEQLAQGADWVHIDLRKPDNGVRYFKP